MIQNILLEEYSIQELVKIINELNYFNRIQGSEELEHAGKYIKDILEEGGAINIEYHEFSYSESYGLLEPIIGWWVKGGELILLKPKRKILHSYKDSRTFIVAHSPGGNVEGEVVFIGDGENPGSFKRANVNGKIVLGYGLAYPFYKNAISNGAKGVLIYKKDGISDAVPYMGLFLSRDEAKNANIPIVAISKGSAEVLINYISKGLKPKVAINVDAGFREKPIIPVISAKIGKNRDEIHLYAHYCHPGGTVNDNISGTAALIELALTMSRLIYTNKIEEPDIYSIRFLWFPEYWGSLAYLLNNRPHVIFSVNLDMIGERQNITGSTLNFIKSPPSYFHCYEAVFYYLLRDSLSLHSSFASSRKSLGYRFDVTSYSMGSDHDIYLHFNIPSIMINQWPDTYYHTDKDTFDKLDINLIVKISISVGAASYMISHTKYREEVRRMIIPYFYEYLGNELSKSDAKLIDQRLKYLLNRIGPKILNYIDKPLIKKMMCSIGYINRKDYGLKYRYTGPVGIIPLRRIYNFTSWREYKRIRELMDKNKFMRTLICSLIPLYMREPIGIGLFKWMMENEFGNKINSADLKRIIYVLLKIGLIEKLRDQ